MTIAIVQTGSTGDFNRASLTATSTFGSSTSSGNSILLVGWHNDFGSAGGSISVSDGTAYTLDQNNPHGAGIITTFSASRINTLGGTTAVTATDSGGLAANSGGRVVALEVSGLNAFDSAHSVAATGTSTTPSVGPSGSPLTNPSLIIATFSGISSMAGATTPPSGFTTLATDLTGATGSVGYSAYQIVTSTSALTAALGSLTTATNWTGGLAIYSGAGGTSYTLSGAFGTYVVGGEAATLTQGSGTAYILISASGTYDYTGAASSSGIQIDLETGTYTVTGVDAGLLIPGGFTLIGNVGDYSLSGQNSTLSVSSAVLQAVTGIYSVTGQGVALFFSGSGGSGGVNVERLIGLTLMKLGAGM